MTDKRHYKSISLRLGTIKKLDVLSNNLSNGINISRAKAVEKLINDSFNSKRDKGIESYENIQKA